MSSKESIRLHQQALKLIDEGEYAEASKLEEEAAKLCQQNPSKGLLFRSAAWCALQTMDLDRANSLAAEGLSNFPHRDYGLEGRPQHPQFSEQLKEIQGIVRVLKDCKDFVSRDLYVGSDDRIHRLQKAELLNSIHYLLKTEAGEGLLRGVIEDSGREYNPEIRERYGDVGYQPSSTDLEALFEAAMLVNDEVIPHLTRKTGRPNPETVDVKVRGEFQV